MKVDLIDKVVVITGSSRGIGKALALAMSRNGAKVVINYKSHAEDAFKLQDIISKEGHESLVVYADVTKEDDVKKMHDQVIQTFGRVDILVNNVGVNKDAFMLVMSENSWDKVIDSNLKSVFLCSKYFAKSMVKNKEGKIFNIASYKGQVGCDGQTNYSASKGGVLALTKSIARELAVFGISVNAICPGFIITDMNCKSEKKINAAKSKSLLGIEKNMDSLVNTIIFMASDNFMGITGQVFNIDSRLI